MDEVTLGQVALSASVFPCQYIPPVLHTILRLYVALTTRTNLRSLGIFQKAVLFCKSGSSCWKRTSISHFQRVVYLYQILNFVVSS